MLNGHQVCHSKGNSNRGDEEEAEERDEDDDKKMTKKREMKKESRGKKQNKNPLRVQVEEQDKERREELLKNFGQSTVSKCQHIKVSCLSRPH